MSDKRLEGKVALITGAGRGFGEAIAELFAEEGADLILNYRNSREGCERIAEKARAVGRRALIIQGDVTQEDAINKLVDQGLSEFGQIDILVNNAGVMAVNLFAESTPDQWKSDIDTNIYGPLMLTRKILPHMIERHSGRIINLSSQLAVNGAAEVSVYSGTKGFIKIWTQALAKEVGQYGINVNSIGPGAIPTDMSVHFTGSEEQRRQGAARNPLHHLGVPHDVAECALFLATDASSFMTGQMLVVNGGSIVQ